MCLSFFFLKVFEDYGCLCDLGGLNYALDLFECVVLGEGIGR